jgi:hypothetical protein
MDTTIATGTQTMASRFDLSYNPQLSSVLFRIPSRLRHLILRLALSPYFDTSKPTPFDSLGYRPSHAFAITQAVALLRTCQRVYAEAHTLPAELATHTRFACWADRALRGRIGGPGFNYMTYEQRRAVRCVHLFA